MQTKHITSTDPPEDLRALGQAITRLRTERGMSTAELAQTVGIAQQHLEAIQDGHEDPGYELLKPLATALEA